MFVHHFYAEDDFVHHSDFHGPTCSISISPPSRRNRHGGSLLSCNSKRATENPSLIKLWMILPMGTPIYCVSFIFFGISNCHAPEGKWMFLFPPWHPEQQIQGSYVGFDWEEFRQGSWRQLCWDKVNLVCKPVGKSVNVHSWYSSN